jgi:hypothetical protein
MLLCIAKELLKQNEIAFIRKSLLIERTPGLEILHGKNVAPGSGQKFPCFRNGPFR